MPTRDGEPTDGDEEERAEREHHERSMLAARETTLDEAEVRLLTLHAALPVTDFVKLMNAIEDIWPDSYIKGRDGTRGEVWIRVDADRAMFMQPPSLEPPF